MQSLEPERERSLPRTLFRLLEKRGCPSTPSGGEPLCGSRGILASQRIWSQGNRERERSASGSPDIASLNFLASRLASLRPLLQKKVGRRREIISYVKATKPNPGLPLPSFLLVALFTSPLGEASIPSSCPGFADKETKARGVG